MSLIVQVAGAGGQGAAGAPPPGAAPPPQKGVVITATSVSGARQPPPAHVTTPFSFHDPPQHVVQTHPQPAPNAAYPRPLPLSPGRPPVRMRQDSNQRIIVNHQLPTQPLPSHHLPLLSPSPAHTLLAAAGVNSPSLIPQNIPSAYMPRLPIHLSSASLRSGGGHGHHPGQHRSPLHVSHHVPDNNILPPHAIRKLTRPAPMMTDDDVEADSHGPPPHPRHRSMMSPKLNKKSLFNNVALQDHNYCAAPPPSPPRSPTPPISPYTGHHHPHAKMGVMTTKETLIEAETNSHLASYNLTPSSPGHLGSIGGYPSPHYQGSLASPKNRLKKSLEDAGVGPMTPLGGDRSKDRSISDNMEDGGEETETAPDDDGEDGQDEDTRCICEMSHDDGDMIQCDKCSVWQHIICMGLDKNNRIALEQDQYFCERCKPRPVDRKRAKAIQKARKREILKRMNPGPPDSSDDDKLKNADKKGKSFGGMGKKLTGKKALEKKLLEGKKILKKPHKRRVFKDGSKESLSPGSPSKKTGPGAVSPRKNVQRKSLSATDAEDETEEPAGETLSLRSWIDNYEEAVTNHYSPELRARLAGAKIPTSIFKPKDVSGIRCNVSLRGNGLKVLTANSYIPSDSPVLECRGKYMLNNPSFNKASRSNPYVLHHRLSADLEVLVDGTTYGNDSRFCRRASSSTGESNAVIKHHLEKGSLHLYIVASRNIEKNSEILLPPLERKNGVIEEEMSIADELREIKKASGKLVNGNAEGGRKKILNKKRVLKRENSKKKDDVSSSDEDEEVRAEREARIAKEKERLAKQREEREKAREDKTSPRKTRSAVTSNDIKEEEMEEDVKDVKEDSKPLSIDIPKAQEAYQEGSGSVQNSPASGRLSAKPALGLPDQSGLIVGVNTINYDASLRNKTKTREERKMEMIMKAFEAMERNEARKRNESDPQTKPEKKRRRSNSNKTGAGTAGDSALDQSSADEGYGGSNKRKTGRGRRQTGAASVSGSRRRSRAKSGDSSNVSENETADENINDHFKYPGHRASEDHDDDVSKQYIRGSRSPPGIANHLLRSARTDKAKDVAKKPVETVKTPDLSVADIKASGGNAGIGCSAKKRWLMAAMSVDMSEVDEASGTSPAQISPEPDYTPLKKRRLQTYNNDATEDTASNNSEDTSVSEKFKVLPNGLKKRLISNLVLEAVLDRAMEDYQPGSIDSNNEDTSSPYINDDADEANHTSDQPKSFKDKRKQAIYEQEELDRRSANSSESEEAQNDVAAEVNNCSKKVYVPMKKCAIPSEDKAEPSPANSKHVPDDSKLDDDVPVEEKEFSSNPLDEDCSTPLQDEAMDTAEEETAAAVPPVPSQHCQFKSFFSTDLSVEDIDRQLQAKREALVKEQESAGAVAGASPLSDDSRPGSAAASDSLSALKSSSADGDSKPNIKKRVSLADYKKRKQNKEGSECSTPTTAPTTPISLTSSLPPLSLPSLPSLPGINSFNNKLSEKHSESSQKPEKDVKSGASSGAGSPSEAPLATPPPAQEPPSFTEHPREDLTERLRKEFGLNVDESDEADTDTGGENDKVETPTEEKVKVVAKEARREGARSERREHGSGSSGSSSNKTSDYSRQNSKHSDSSSKSSSRDSYSSDKSSSSHNKYSSDKRDYRDSRQDRDKRDSRHHDRSRYGSRRPSHPSSPSGDRGRDRGMSSMTNGGGSRRHHASPSRRSSQDAESRYSNSHSSSSYYKSESSRRNNISRNFYTQ